MKKRVLYLLVILISSFFFVPQVFAYEYFEKIEIKTAFDESINTEEIGNIYLSFQIDATEQGLPEVEEFDVKLTHENKFYDIYNNKIIFGDIQHIGTKVGLDAGSQTYKSVVQMNFVSEKVLVVQVVVTLKDPERTKSTADMTDFEEMVKEYYMDEEQRELYEEYKEAQKEATSTTTTTSPGVSVVVTDPATGNPIIDPVTGEQVTTIVPTTTTTTKTTLSPKQEEQKKKEEDKKKEKEQRDKKETTILVIMLSIIGGVVVFGGIFVVIKIYQASKLR